MLPITHETKELGHQSIQSLSPKCPCSLISGERLTMKTRSMLWDNLNIVSFGEFIVFQESLQHSLSHNHCSIVNIVKILILDCVKILFSSLFLIDFFPENLITAYLYKIMFENYQIEMTYYRVRNRIWFIMNIKWIKNNSQAQIVIILSISRDKIG